MSDLRTYTLSTSELRARLADAVADVERGCTITITRNGRPVATLAPARPDRPPLDLGAVRARLAGGRTVQELLDEDRAER